ncbi:MAG TPA: DUF3817 domain-containing protein [Jiangellaceae bacterium]|nr:DUF3817 domain-containing protein [Jiangellaceae bacterium]
MTPKRLFATFAFAEAVTWTLLILGMILEYGVQATELGVRIGGGVHGFVFLTYCVVTVLVGTSQRWSLGRIMVGLVAAVVPYATIPFEIATRRRGLLFGEWQLRRGARPARHWFDRLCRWAISNPWLAVVVGVVVVSVVFVGLLMLGPPISTG